MIWPRTLTNDFSQATALVADANTSTRSVISAQLRELGIRSIRQVSRASDARKHLEAQTFDIVLCEQDFPQESITGQELLDDLRRGGMLPLTTIFIMVTPEASYAKVAEAAESMLDGYLLKPFTAARLLDRITVVRKRKVAMQDIYQVIEEQQFAQAAKLCVERFEEGGIYAIYAARIGAELLLRVAQFDLAQKLYQAVNAAEPQNWARLGMARVQLELGEPHKAKPLLEALLADQPGYADAWDNMGRAQMELGQFEEALAAYKSATDLTPSSIARLQRHGMLSYYLGDKTEAIGLLERSARLGLGSKMFDAQTLVLLAMQRFEIDEPRLFKGFLQDLKRMFERNPESVRLRRMMTTLSVLNTYLDQGKEAGVEALMQLADAVLLPDFDFEAACNLLSISVLLQEVKVELPDLGGVVTKIGMRFGTSKAMTDLLVSAAKKLPAFAESLTASNTEVMRQLDVGLSYSRNGDPAKSVLALTTAGSSTLNAKMVETAWRVLKRYEASIPNAAEMAQTLEPLRQSLGTAYNKPVLGDRNMRQSGGVSLRGMDAPPLQPTMAPTNVGVPELVNKSTPAAS